MKFPYYTQESAYTCGAASMRMALEFVGIKKTEKQLARLLGTNKIIGTWDKDFPRIAEKYKLNYVVEREVPIKELRRLRKEGYIVIVCFYYPPEKVSHFSVVKKIGSKYIYFWDPWFGPNKKYLISYFNKIWRNNTKNDKDRHWFFALKKKI